MIKTAVLILAAFSAPDQPPQIRVRVDTQFASSVLGQVCSDQPIDESAIRSSAAVNQMVDHFAQFRADFTLDAYVEARRLAARCRTAEPDIFRFGEVIARREELQAEIATIAAEQSEYAAGIEQMLAQYSPEGMRFSGSATLVIGSPSCGGWSSNGDFYVDVPCLKGDRVGLQYLIAHESYHAIQSRFMGKTPAEPPLALILDAIIREGSAMRVADFSQISNPGAYAQLSQRVLRTNRRRLVANVELFEVSVHYLLHSADPTAAERINNIGLSGQFDSPFYSVGELVIARIDQQLGRAALLCLLEGPAVELFISYSGLPADNQYPTLASETIAAIRTLRTAESEQHTHRCTST
ncbi:MAG: hypothetical protein KDI71_16300 [Xanthomonadales bacterium]|nr:hypothetical protein [Xanthomonadales bacterium]